MAKKHQRPQKSSREKSASAAPQLPVTQEGLGRLRSGHPWLYEDHLAPKAFRLLEAAVVPLGEHWFFYSPQSKLRLRRLGPSTRLWPNAEIPRAPVTTTEDFARLFGAPLRELFARSLQSRLALRFEGDACFRWIFAENDFVPGLLVEAYGPVLIAQIQSAPVEKFWPVLKQLLVGVYAEGTGLAPAKVKVIEQRHLPVRKLEGLEVIDDARSEERHTLRWNGFEWDLCPGGSQKTGSYLDQADNHRRTAELAVKMGHKTAWDICCFEGGFGLHLLKAGLSVLAVDQSERALEAVKKNVATNKLPAEKLETRQDDVFEFLKAEHQKGTKVDLIVLDPPSFVKNPKDKDRAIRAFRDLNLRALHCLKPGGLLVSCSCSHHISPEDYRKMLKGAAHDARRSVRILEVKGPAPDHAPLLGFIESEYLQAWYLEVLV
jgi:23S rRNA (cytosine1962-C5)-methyltransferase